LASFGPLGGVGHSVVVYVSVSSSKGTGVHGVLGCIIIARVSKYRKSKELYSEEAINRTQLSVHALKLCIQIAKNCTAVHRRIHVRSV
jgi:hypothetical protein